MSDLTFGVKITADGKQLVGEVRASREELDKLGTSAQRAAQQTKSYWAEQQQQANASAAAWLKGNAAADAAADKAWALANGYKEVGGQILKSGGESAKAASDLGLNTQYARRELMQLGKEAVTGDFSRMPRTFGALVTHSNLLQAAISPIGLAVTGVTAALVTGAVAWNHWENVAVESAGKTMKAIRDAHGESERIASMNITSIDAEIESVKKIVTVYEAYASHVRAGITRFNWRDSAAQLHLYNAEITKNEILLAKLNAASAEQRKEFEGMSGETRFVTVKFKELTDQEKAGKLSPAEYAAAIKKMYADLSPKADKSANPVNTAYLAALKEAINLQDAAIGKAEGLNQAQTALLKIQDSPVWSKYSEQKKLEIANHFVAASAAEQEAQAVLYRRKQIEDSVKGGAILGGLGSDFDAEISKKNRALNDTAMSAADNQHADNLDMVAQRAAKAREELAKLGITEDARAQLLVSVGQVEAEQIRRMEELRQQVEKNNASWEYGANVALRNYRDEAANVAKQSESLFTKGFKSMEDAVTRFAMTGKLSIRDFAQTVIEEFYRINVSRPLVSAGAGLLQSAMGAVGGYFGGSSAGASASTAASFGPSAAAAGTTDYMALAGFRADGGPVDANSLYRVNEKVPEVFSSGGNDYLMTGGRGGQVTPLTQAKTSSGDGQSQPITLVYNPSITIDARNATPGMEQTLARVVNQAVEQTRAVLLAELGAGGQFALATGRRR